eukprot:jgi/Chrpa1/2715/Chrysochromulina_OHIO_Genome00003455-RA
MASDRALDDAATADGTDSALFSSDDVAKEAGAAPAAPASGSRSFEKASTRAAPAGVLLTRLSASSFFMAATLWPLTASNVIPVMMPFCCANVPSTTSTTTTAPLL